MIDECCSLKLIDFGVAAPLQGTDSNGKLHGLVGTDGYMAPEIL
jgi:serine/threonine protein kinase